MRTQKELTQHLIDHGKLKTPVIIDAFQKINRRDFIPEEFEDVAYGDYPIPIGDMQTNSQPGTVAFMLEQLRPKPGQKLLDVGSGSGWTTALLAHIVGPKGKVYGMEIIPHLVEYGSKNLAKYPYPHAKIHPAHKGEMGFPAEAPYDGILVSASAHSLPQELLTQLSPGARLVIPIGHSVWCYTKISEKKYEKNEFPGYAFVPLQQQYA